MTLILVTSSCQTDLDLQNVIDENSPFTLSIRTENLETGLTEHETEKIEVESEKWRKLIDFLYDNSDGWQSSPASYIGDIYVNQDDFRLIRMKGTSGVVIAFTDKEGEPQQYTKKIDKGELDFLTE